MAGEHEAADELLRRGRYAEAIEHFRNLLSQEPENAELRAKCGEAYRLAGNRERAFHHFNKAAAIYWRLQDAASALRLLIYANVVSPNEPDILFRMAECKRALGEERDLEPLLYQIISVARGSGDRRRLWALEVLAERHPEDLDVQEKRAETLAEAGRILEAAQIWRGYAPWFEQRGVDLVPSVLRAAASAPDRPDLAVELSNVLIALHRPREALSLLVPIYEKLPDDIPILETLLRALEAIGATEKIIPARIELIKARAKRGLREATMKEIAVLLASAPEDPAALEVSAHAYQVFQDLAHATALWRQLMFIYERQGRRFERDRAILMLLKANPDDVEALALGARALREAGRNGEADVLEARLAALKRLRARAAQSSERKSGEGSRKETPPSRDPTGARVAQRPRAPGAPEKGKQTLSDEFEARFGFDDRAPDAFTDESNPFENAGTMLLDDGDVLATHDERKSMPPRTAEDTREDEDALEHDDPTIPPSEALSQEFAVLSELSEPSVEAMGVSTNPWADGLELTPVPDLTATVTRTVERRPLSPAEDPRMNLPPEGPASAEETTSRLAEMIVDELYELRHPFEEAHPTKPAAPGYKGRSRPPEDFADLDGGRPTQRLGSDLVDERGRLKKI